MSFFFGGFIQFAARLARQYIRPFVLLPNPAGSSLAPIAPNPPTTAKRLYDAAGIFVSAALLNYAVAPFQLLDFKRSLSAWWRMDLYGHVLIGGAIIFFQNGGKKICRDALKKRGIEVGGKKPAAAVAVAGAVPNGKTSAPSVVNGSTPTTPGQLGAPNGFSLTVPHVEQGVKEAQGALEDLKKTQ